jgi:hypothetical protein
MFQGLTCTGSQSGLLRNSSNMRADCAIHYLSEGRCDQSPRYGIVLEHSSVFAPAMRLISATIDGLRGGSSPLQLDGGPE